MNLIYQQIQQQIPSTVRLVAVSKQKPIDQIMQLYQLGHLHFGENVILKHS